MTDGLCSDPKKSIGSLPQHPQVSLVVVVVKTRKETSHGSDSTGECNAPLHLPRCEPQNETWHYNQGQCSDYE